MTYLYDAPKITSVEQWYFFNTGATVDSQKYIIVNRKWGGDNNNNSENDTNTTTRNLSILKHGRNREFLILQSIEQGEQPTSPPPPPTKMIGERPTTTTTKMIGERPT